MTPETIAPDWPSPRGVHAFVTTRAWGDMRRGASGRDALRTTLPSEPRWLRQVHGAGVARLDGPATDDAEPQADAAVTRTRGAVCAVLVADCMPVLLADAGGEVIGLAHAGWRGMVAGVIGATLEAMAVDPAGVSAWLGPAIGPGAYEVGDDVRAAFLKDGIRVPSAFRATRPGHWQLDLYAIARLQLARAGVAQVFGGRYCTFSDPARFYSFRRDRGRERMAALAWLD